MRGHNGFLRQGGGGGGVGLVDASELISWRTEQMLLFGFGTCDISAQNFESQQEEEPKLAKPINIHYCKLGQ